MKLKYILKHLGNCITDFIDSATEEIDIKRISHPDEKLEGDRGDVLFYGYSHEFSENTMGRIILTNKPVHCQYGCENNFIIVPEKELEKSIELIQELLSQEPVLIRFKNEMLDAIMENKSLSDILKTSYDYLKNPLIITDARYRLIDLYPDVKLNEPVWDEIRELGHASQKFMNEIESDNTKEVTLSRGYPFYLDWGFASDFRRIGIKISEGDKIFGVLGVLERFVEFQEIHRAISYILSNTIKFILQKEELPGDEESSYKETLLSNLIEGDVHDKKSLQEAFQISKSNWKPPYRLASILIPITSSSLMDLKETQETVMTGITSVQSTIRRSNIVFLLYGKDMDKSLIALEQSIGKMNRPCGLSSEFYDLLDTPAYHTQASIALKFAEGDSLLCFYENIYMDHMKKILCESNDKKVYIHPKIYILAEHDREHQTEYLQTLYNFLNAYKNTAVTADSMHVHRNTLNYRIKRAEEIMEISLEDDELCRYIQVSLDLYFDN